MSLPREFLPATRLRRTEPAGVSMPTLSATQRLANLKRPVTMSTFLPTAIHAVGVRDIAGPQTATNALSLEKMRALRCRTGENKQRSTFQSAIVDSDEMSFIRTMTNIESKEQKLANTALLKQQKEAQGAESRQKRERMKTLDMNRSSKMPPTEAETQEAQEKERIVKRAQLLLDEQEDNTKRMNSMVMYSKVVTIRDQQVKENKRLKQKAKDEETRLDLVSEVVRLKALNEADKRTSRMEAAARQGALTIMEQMKENREKKQREMVALQEEKKQILAKMANQRAVDAEAQLKREAQVAKVMEAVKESNAESIKLKALRKTEEQALEQQVIDYNKKKMALEEEKAKEAKRLADEKERDIQRLREAQEKAADRQAEIDQLRAKRAFEQNERDCRAAERARQEKAEADRIALDVARKRQFADQQAMRVNAAEAERVQYMRIIKQQKEEEEREKNLEAERVQALIRHKKTIQAQIAKNEEKSKQARLDYLEDGKRSRDQIEEARQRIQRIKQTKVKGLHDLNINDKYKVELQAFKIDF